MSRKATIIGQVIDYEGQLWDVRESRETVHGWPLLIGWPADGTRGPGGGGPRAIITDELAEYLESMRLTPPLIVLPIGRTTINRLRALLDHYWYQDNAKWWKDNPEGPGRSDAAKSNWRKRLKIKTDRWTDEEDASLTNPRRDGAGNTEIAERLNRTEAGVRTRRWRLKMMDKEHKKIGAPLRFPPPTGDPFRDRIIALRLRLGISQSALGERMGISDAAISRLESGLRKPSGSVLKLLEILDREASDK